MKILVFVNQVPDTDDVKLDPKTGNIMREGVASKLNPLDANAVEAAIQLKEKYGAAVCAISMGPPQAEEVLKKALALGCDEAYLLSDAYFRQILSGTSDEDLRTLDRVSTRFVSNLNSDSGAASAPIA